MFLLVNVAGRAALEHDVGWHDLAAVAGYTALADPMAAVARHDELHRWQAEVAHRTADGVVDAARLGPAVPRPQKVFAIGLNYRKHAEETGAPLPPAPLTFTKFPSCLNGPAATIELSGDTVDWEVELVVVIGRGGRHIARADAWAHVAGLSLGQDISDRTVQRLGTPPQYSLGKSFDGYGPVGPAVVSVDSFPNPDDIELWCEVSGERMQHDRTSDLIFGVPELVEYLSAICTLTPGDLIFTGTPGGVGMARGRFLQPGDTIDSGASVIGTMHHTCVAPTG
jgi:2-keto-4-pentenoate hydratase/2-oxohepta-3-ene-1,7-dioic acid hydratase in catechol pathway